jgi:hypothetical protein
MLEDTYETTKEVAERTGHAETFIRVCQVSLDGIIAGIKAESERTAVCTLAVLADRS